MSVSRSWLPLSPLVASTAISPAASPDLGSNLTAPLLSLNVPWTECIVAPSVHSILVCAGSSVTCTCCAAPTLRSSSNKTNAASHVAWRRKLGGSTKASISSIQQERRVSIQYGCAIPLSDSPACLPHAGCRSATASGRAGSGGQIRTAAARQSQESSALRRKLQQA